AWPRRGARSGASSRSMKSWNAGDYPAGSSFAPAVAGCRLTAAMPDSRVIYGFHAVTSRLRQNAAGVQEIYLDRSRSDARARDLAPLARDRRRRAQAVRA